ncbi:hypothetical protein [Burkholderia sp. BCC0405]|uniref:hypothetical protein n=1 Tax=Burkholderia sp. BCC0405 TaxID=2676298 RepID=UPI001589577A|nr:hypothetical protein [Burkholderia sp. BCC0405]
MRTKSVAWFKGTDEPIDGFAGLRISAGAKRRTCVYRYKSPLYCAYFIRKATGGTGDVSLFRDAEAALRESAVRGEKCGNFTPSVDGGVAIQRVLSLYVQQLLSVPVYIVVGAEDRVAEFLSSDAPSPIAREPKQRPLH